MTISRVENGRHGDRPRPSTVRRLAAALGVGPAWLLYGGDGDDGDEETAARAIAPRPGNASSR